MTIQEAIISKHDVAAEATLIDRKKERSLYLVQHVGTFTDKDAGKYNITTNGSTIYIIERQLNNHSKWLCVQVDIRKALDAALKLLIAEENKP